MVPIQDVVARYQEHIETQIEAKYPEMRGIDLGAGVVMSKQHDGHVLIGYVPPNIIDGVFLIELNVCKVELISVGRGHVR